MFDLFGNSRRLQEIESSVSQSFARVKDDTQHLQQWVAYLYQQNQQLQSQNEALRRLADEQKIALNELKVTVRHLPKTPVEIRELVESHFDWKPLLERVRRIEQKIELLEVQSHKVQFRPLEHNSPSVSSVPHAQVQVPVQHSVQPPVQERKPQVGLRDRLMRKLARNSKEYIRNVILGLVQKYVKISAMQLREILVEEQGLCSKSSFYRIVEEMEKDGTLARSPQAGKQAVYVAH